VRGAGRRSSRPAKKRDELSPSHSITSSAKAMEHALQYVSNVSSKPADRTAAGMPSLQPREARDKVVRPC